MVKSQNYPPSTAVVLEMKENRSSLSIVRTIQTMLVCSPQTLEHFEEVKKVRMARPKIPYLAKKERKGTKEESGRTTAKTVGGLALGLLLE